MNLKNGEREPSDEEDGIPERQYDFNLVVMDESDANEENLVYDSSTSDSETVYSHSLSGVPPPSPALARHSSNNLTVEEEAEPDSITESSSPTQPQSQPPSESALRTPPPIFSGILIPAEDHVDREQSLSNFMSSMFRVEIVREIIDDVLTSFIFNSDSETTVENQEADADENTGSPSVLASNIRIHLEDLVPLESCPSSQSTEAAGSGEGENVDNGHPVTENPSLVPFPSSASTLILSQSPETIPAGSGLSSGLVLSPDKEPPVPIARSSPFIHNFEERSSEVLHNLKDGAALATQGDHENNPSETEEDDLDDLDEEEFESESDSGDDADCFMGVMKGIEQLQPKSNEKEMEALNVSQEDMFASQSQESQPTHESHPIEEVEVEYSTAALKNFVKAVTRKPQCIDDRTDQPDPSQEQVPSTSIRQVAVIVPNDNQTTPGIVTQAPAATAEDPPAVGAKRPREEVDEFGGDLQAQEPDKARRKLDFHAKKKRMSKSKRAGLVFPVSKINNRIKEGKYAKRSGVTAGVYLAGVLEYLVAEVAELAGRVAVHQRKHRITPRHIQLAILSDEEINILTKGIIIPQGGVIPWIHPSILPKKDKKTRQDCQGKYGFESHPIQQTDFM